MRVCEFSLVFVLVILLLAPPLASAASLTFDASVKEVYENNINPLLSGAGIGARADCSGALPVGARLEPNELKPAAAAGTDISDFYTVLSASGGGQAEIGVETEMSVKAEVTRYQFNKFSELSATTAGASTGLFKQFSDINSVRIGIAAKLTEYETEPLDAGSVAGTVDLRQQFSLRFWIQEGLAWEKTSANDNSFSYTAQSASLRAGYRLPEERTLSLGYLFDERKFLDGAKMAIHSLALTDVRRIIPHLTVTGELERQWYETVPAHTHATDTITSVAITYSY